MTFSKLYEKYSSKQYPPLLPSEIKDIRRTYDLSQKSFADLLGITVCTLQFYEIGRRRTPSAASALLLLAKDHPEVFLEKMRTAKFLKKTRGFVK